MAAAAPAADRVGIAELLRVPGFARLSAASLVGRTPGAALGLVFILRTRELTGSYAVAGLVAGAHAASNGLTAPLLGRLVDRRGQGPVLLPAAAATALALLAYALMGPGTPAVAMVAAAAVAGAAFPPLGPCLRTLWPALLGSDPGRTHAAFALESAALEATYIAGPVLIAGAIGSQSTAAATLTCAALLLAGTLAFATHPASLAWRSGAAAAPGRGGALRSPGVRTLMLVFGLIGATFGAVEVAVPAAAEAAGAAGATGLLLGLWGLGSLLGGLATARRGAPADPVRRLVLLLAALAGGHLTLVAAGSAPALAALLLVAGVAIAPAISTAYSLVGGVAPRGAVTEAYTWLATGIAGGVAAGAALAGVLAEADGAGATFALAAATCAGAAVLGALRRGTLAPQRASSRTSHVAPPSPERLTLPSSEAT
jgi:predicted MFS family arabinose efflux permease